MNKTLIGVDIGGTRIKSVAISNTGEVIFNHFQNTNDGDGQGWKNAVKTAIQTVIEKVGENISSVGISAPGLPNDQNSAIAYMPGRLQGIENFIWSAFLEKDAVVYNDAISALMAEARFGAAKGGKNVIMLTLGTGVGGGILIDGKPYQGAFQKAGHLGHMTVDSEGEPDIIGIPGSLEDAIGNCTLEKRTNGKFTSTHDLIIAHKKGDEFASKIWMKSVKDLGVSLASLTNILSPEVIILGGGITEANEALFDPLKQFMEKYEWCTSGNRVKIVKAQYGELAGAIGAACLSQ